MCKRKRLGVTGRQKRTRDTGELHLQVGLSVESGRRDKGETRGVRRGEEHEVARDALAVLHAHDVAHVDRRGLDLR